MPKQKKVTDEEVEEVFRSFFEDRAAANVLFGKIVTKVSFSNGAVSVVFDPAAANVTQEVFEQINAYDNLASFAATPIIFDNEIGNRIRPVVNSIHTAYPDGKSLGIFSRTDILARNNLEA